ncbi:outer membrane protein [Caulobacter sp. KR2-114]|uniref:outer membrane protein n=1 Tax=Caulobacter sp. KR2-114 TaxID=3400912 RepID=UPI003C088D31
MMRSVVLASAFTLSLGALGLAAPAFAQSADGQSWSGPYVGLNLGYGGGTFNYPYSGTTDAAGATAIGGKARQNSSGIVGGGQAGYDYQTPGGWVLGVVTDIDGTNIHGDTAFSGLDASGNATTGQLRSQIDYLGTFRVRGGEAMFGGRLLPYVTGGLAYGGVSSNASFACSSCGSGGAAVANGLSRSSTQVGWTVGAGADYALTPRISLRAEYLYVDLGRQNLTGGGEFTAPGVAVFNATVNTDTTANVARLGVNYRF